MKHLVRTLPLLASLVSIGCGDEPTAGTVKPEPSASARASSSAPVPPASSAPKAASDPPVDCGGLECTAYDTVGNAFASVLEDKPLILAIGETHAQKAGSAVPSVTKRFTEELLPALKERASGLVVEIPYPDAKCSQAKVDKVATEQKEIIKTQSDDNQSEFKKLVVKSKDLGIAADGLKLSCADLDRLDKAGEDKPIEWLLTITRNMTSTAKTFFDENKKKSPEKMILTYGGAIHNDSVPTPGRESWSFAKDLDALSKNRYIELDLVVPEFVSDAKNWQSMPWYEAIKKGAMCTGDGAKRKKTIVYKTSAHAYALVFPCTPA